MGYKDAMIEAGLDPETLEPVNVEEQDDIEELEDAEDTEEESEEDDSEDGEEGDEEDLEEAGDSDENTDPLAEYDNDELPDNHKVPLKEFRKIRAKAKQAEEDAKQAKDQLLQYFQQMQQQQMAAAQQQPLQQQTVEEEVPDPELDPDAYVQWKLKRQEQELEYLRQANAAQQQSTYIQQAKQHLSAIESEYSKKAADYAEVKQHGIAKLMNNYRLTNPNVPEYQIRQHIEQQILASADQVYRQGKDPAEYIYQMIVNNWGKPTKNVAKGPDLKAINENQARSKSLSTASGKKPSLKKQSKLRDLENMSPSDLAKIPFAELQKLLYS